MTNEQKEAISYAQLKMQQLVEELTKNKRTDVLPYQEGFLYALECFFEYDEDGNCVGINDITVNEWLARKYLELEKTNSQ